MDILPQLRIFEWFFVEVMNMRQRITYITMQNATLGLLKRLFNFIEYHKK